MSETGTREWKVWAVREGDVVDNPHGGKLQKFYVDFEGSPDTYWRRKSGDTPEVGKSYYGTISEGQYGPMFKKEKPQDGGGSSGGSGSRPSGGSASREWKPESQYDPEKTARIGRAHAQHMAILTCQAQGLFESQSAGQIEAKLKGWTDFFQADVEDAAKAARPGGGSTGNGSKGLLSPVKPPAVQSGDEARGVHERLMVLLENAGQNDRAAKQMADFALDQMSAEEQDAAIGMLENPERQVAAVERLRERTESFNGEPLPSAGADESSIPF